MPNYHEKTKDELAGELQTRDLLIEERKVSDHKYAIKLVERIVFALVTILLVAVLGAIIKTAIT